MKICLIKKYRVFFGLVFFAIILGIPMAIQARDIPDKVTCRIDMDRSVLPAGDSQNVIIKVTLAAPSTPAGIKRPNVNLSLVLDQSGSMQGIKIRQAKAAAIEAVKRLGMGDIFSVVVYDTNINTIVPAQKINNLQWMIDRIGQIQANGSTALFGGVSQGAAEIRKNLESDLVHRIVLLSDGLANVGPRTPEDLGRLGAALMKENISVTTVGVGTDYNEDLMTQLSQKSDGNTYFVESGYDLPSIFSAELGDVLNVVAKKVKLIITLPDTIEPVSIIGREGRIKNRDIELYMNQLYGAQEKYALVEVKVPRTKEGSKLKIATAQVMYENPFTQKQEISNGVSYASFSKDKRAVEKSVNVDVVREYELNINALMQEEAIKMLDGGRRMEAQQALQKQAAKLKQAGNLYKDKRLLEEAKEMEVQADSIQNQKLDKKSRKVLRTKSYQMKNQQNIK